MLLHMDGFDSYATADLTKKYNSTTGGVTINASSGRRSSGALVFGGGTGTLKKVLASTYSTLVVGFAFSPTSFHASNNIFFHFYEGATQHIYLKIDASNKIAVYRGGGTLLGTATNALSSGTFVHLDIKVNIHDSTGSFVLKINGGTEINLSSIDTRNGGTGVIDTVYFGDPGTFAQAFTADDFSICDTSGSTNNNHLGDCRIDTIYPTSDGNYSQFTPSTGTTHYTLVDETAPNTSDYNDGATVGDRDSYGMGNLSALTSQTIYGVQVNAAILKDDAGAKSAATFVRSSSTNGDGASVGLGTSQVYLSQIFELDPNGSIAWTESSINAMEAGVKVT